MSGASLGPTSGLIEFRFGTFQLVPARELLLESGRPVRIGSRALRILTLLIERPGELIGREELISLVWPDTFVENGNLKVHIAALRRILGDGRANSRFIINVPGRGYRFVAEVIRTGAEPAPPIAAVASRAPSLPALLTRMIGRNDVLDAISRKLGEHRIVTIAGAGGIGKTTVALAVADRIAAQLEDRAVFAELAFVSTPDLLPSVLSSALGVRAVSGDLMTLVLESVGPKEMLLVLDNCEHLIHAVAALAETLLHAAPRLKILTTSREPLRTQGEHVHRLEPLTLPPEGVVPSVAAALDFSAIALFVERARAEDDTLNFVDTDIPLVVQICRQLDGLPLALELAAARVETFGLPGLAARLDNRFAVLTAGRRTAIPRQKTLRATLDWSFELLSEREQHLLSRLGAFVGAFTLDQAAAAGDASDTEVLDDLANLVSKSLLTVDASEDDVRYSLLESTKVYAMEKLHARDEFDDVLRRCTQCLCEIFTKARPNWSLKNSRAWVGRYGYCIGDLRAAVDWAFAEGRDVELGASLVVEASPLWIDLGLLPEFFERAQRALQALTECQPRNLRLEMRLSSAVGHTIYELGARPHLTPTMMSAFASAAQIAKELDDAEQRFRSLISQCIANMALGEYQNVPLLTYKFHEVARKLKRSDIDLYRARSNAVAHLFMGDLDAAERFVDQALRDPEIARRVTASDDGFDFDPLLFTRNVEARLRWMRGFPDQALKITGEIIEDALALGHLPSFLNAYQVAIMPISVWHGHSEFIKGPLERCVLYGETHGLDYRSLWRPTISWGLDGRAQNWDFGRARKVIAERSDVLGVYVKEVLATFHPGFTSREMINRVREDKSGWCAAEIIRADGEEKWFLGDMDGAAASFHEALSLAHKQGARAWELRAATSLCRLRMRQGNASDERDVLASIVQSYTEGFNSWDMKDAAAMLAA